MQRHEGVPWFRHLKLAFPVIGQGNAVASLRVGHRVLGITQAQLDVYIGHGAILTRHSARHDELLLRRLIVLLQLWRAHVLVEAVGRVELQPLFLGCHRGAEAILDFDLIVSGRVASDRGGEALQQHVPLPSGIATNDILHFLRLEDVALVQGQTVERHPGRVELISLLCQHHGARVQIADLAGVSPAAIGVHRLTVSVQHPGQFDPLDTGDRTGELNEYLLGNK